MMAAPSGFAAVAPAAAAALQTKIAEAAALQTLQNKMAVRKDAMAKELEAVDSAAAAALIEVLRQARPTWKERDLLVVQWKLAKAGVCSVPELVDALQGKKEHSLNHKLTTMGQKQFTTETLKAMRDVAIPAAPESPKRRPSAAGKPGSKASMLAAAVMEAAEAAAEEVGQAKAVDPRAFAVLGPKNHYQDVSETIKEAINGPKRRSRSNRMTAQYFSMADLEEGSGSDEDSEEESRRLSSVYRVYEQGPDDEQDKENCENFEPKFGRLSLASVAEERPTILEGPMALLEGRMSLASVCEGRPPVACEGRPSVACEGRASTSSAPVGKAEDFARWLEQRKPLHRFDQMSTGLAWEWPLARGEKKELLLLQVAAGEEQAAEDAFILRIKSSWEKKKKRSSTVGVGGKYATGAAARRRRRSSIHR